MAVRHNSSAQKDQWCLVNSTQYGLCVGKLTETIDKEQYVADLVKVLNLDPLLRSEEATCRKLHMYVIEGRLPIKAVIPRKAIARKFATLITGDRTLLIAMSPEELK